MTEIDWEKNGGRRFLRVQFISSETNFADKQKGD